ncbi:MAG: HNH endonuclease [Clostridiales Family XIII bacterium]|nr:HNH endonuclease [Clostridiales Family XIII bacterium]
MNSNDNALAHLEAGERTKFYLSRAWRRVRAEVLRIDHYECQRCKERGMYTKAAEVHHINKLTERKDLALSIFDEEGKRNLTSLCKTCHLEIDAAQTEQLNEERWD